MTLRVSPRSIALTLALSLAGTAHGQAAHRFT
jgi:hypothetical protein